MKIFYSVLFAVLALTSGLSLWEGNWQSALLALATILFLLVPFVIERKMNVYFPTVFSLLLSLFLIATIILGEFDNFYRKFWWWDVMLHSGSGIAFGLIGLVVLLIFLKRGKIEAKPYILCFFSFCFALAIGLMWEIVEFSADQLFHTDMQHTETGVDDTMKDEIMDALGAAFGSAIGYLYLRKDIKTPIDKTLDATVRKNKVT